jgi:hypothetical protein
VRVADIISVMPRRLEKASRKCLEMEIAGYLKTKFSGVNMDVHNFKDDTRGMLWAINSSAAEMTLPIIFDDLLPSLHGHYYTHFIYYEAVRP